MHDLITVIKIPSIPLSGFLFFRKKFPKGYFCTIIQFHPIIKIDSKYSITTDKSRKVMMRVKRKMKGYCKKNLKRVCFQLKQCEYLVNIFIQIYPLCPSKYVETHLSKYTHCAPHRAHKICHYILWEFQVQIMFQIIGVKIEKCN